MSEKYLFACMNGSNIPDSVIFSGRLFGSASQSTGGTNGQLIGQAHIPTFGYKKATITTQYSGQHSHSAHISVSGIRTLTSNASITGQEFDISDGTALDVYATGTANQSGSPNPGAYQCNYTYTIILHN